MRKIDYFNLFWSLFILWGLPYFHHTMQFDILQWYGFPLLFTELIVAVSAVVTSCNTFAYQMTKVDVL